MNIPEFMRQELPPVDPANPDAVRVLNLDGEALLSIGRLLVNVPDPSGVANALAVIGSGLTTVCCIGPERWGGTLVSAQHGVRPSCPEGHPLRVVDEGPRLALVWGGEQ